MSDWVREEEKGRDSIVTLPLVVTERVFQRHLEFDRGDSGCSGWPYVMITRCAEFALFANRDIGRALLTVMGDGLRSAAASAVNLGQRQATRRQGELELCKWGGSLRQAPGIGGIELSFQRFPVRVPSWFPRVGDFVIAELMREDGENGMSVIDEVGPPMEEGIVESLCDVVIRTSGLLANYLRFTGRLRYIRGDETVEDPVGTVGSPSVSWRLALGLVDESRRSVFPRRILVWDQFANFLDGTCGR